MLSSTLLTTLVISLSIQAVFFVFAATLRTDKVTDLSYSLTFIILTAILLIPNEWRSLPQFVLALMVIVWGLRLATYLLFRIIVMKRDPRFDGIREKFWKFFQFWFFQGIVAWAIMLPVTIWFAGPGSWTGLMTAGVLVWMTGLVLETAADFQKFRQKRSGPSSWMSSGLWRYSRHPNYFGELLCWWGVFLFVAGDLKGWAWLASAGPLTLTYLLLYVTGIPTLEKSAERKWGSNPAYQMYRKTTSLLLPWPVSTGHAGREP